jgi:cGMP-dependent protein kinase
MKRHNSSEYKSYTYLKLEDMIFIKKLGFGQFGNVYLIKNTIDKNYYALKIISK